MYLLIQHFVQQWLLGYKNSYVHGYIISGLFQGKVALTEKEIYYIERKEKYKDHSELSSLQSVHSVIYREEDMINTDHFLRCVVYLCMLSYLTDNWSLPTPNIRK